MGHTIWVELEGQAFDEATEDNSTTLQLMDLLDALAARLGVQKLSDFCDFSELEDVYEDFDDEGEDLDIDVEESLPPQPSLEERQAKGKWFDAAAALQSARQLRQHLTKQFDDLGFKPDRSTSHWPKQLMAELAYIEKMLKDAASQGVPFRFLIVA